MGKAAAIAEIIAGLGVAGIPVALAVILGGGLLLGFVFWSILSFVSQWFFPLIFFAGAVVIAIEAIPRGGKMALLGASMMVLMLLLAYVLWSGVLNGPSNTYSLLLSDIPQSEGGNQSLVPGSGVFYYFLLAIAGIVGAACGVVGGIRLHQLHFDIL